MQRLVLLAFAAVSLLLASPAVHAAGQARYDQQAFTAAQAAGKPILIAVHAAWCQVCAKQEPIIDKLAATPEFNDLIVLVVDFDSQKDVVRSLGVQKQSTLIILRGQAERDRSTGVTDEAAITALLRKANG
ncbi:MAG: thioredoxin family protein [Acetobacteraceae bacterium]